MTEKQTKAKTSVKPRTDQGERQEFDDFDAQSLLRTFTEGHEPVRLKRYRKIFEVTEEKKGNKS